MKNKLLKGTAAFGLLMAWGAASQDAPQSTAAKLTISGSTTLHMSVFNQDAHTIPGDANTDSVGKGQGYNFSQDDSSLDFTFAGKTDAGLDYLGRISFTGQTGSSTVANNYSVRNRVRQNYVQLGYMGATIQGGALWGTEVTAVSDGSAIMRGDGGFGSNWSSRFNEPFTAAGGAAGNMVYGAYLTGASNTANKVNIITPTVYGFHLSATITPSTAHTGDLYHNNIMNPQGRQVTGGTGTSGTYTSDYANSYFDQNHQAYALSFSESFGVANVALSGATVLSSETKNSNGVPKTYNKTRGYYVGGVVSAFGFDLGGGFYDNKKTGVQLTDSAQGRDGGKTWNVALGWSSGPVAVTFGYLHGKRNNGTTASGSGLITANNSKSTAHLYSITADMKLADGLTTYIDATHAKMTDGSIDPDYQTSAGVKGKKTNKGTVILLGTRVNF